MFNKNLTGNVQFCNQYRHKDQPDKWDLEQIAWKIDPDKKKKGEIGFLPPSKED